MSDFYRSRRIAIKDTTALLTFFIGFVWSGAFVWPFMEAQIDQGDMIRGLAYFLAAVLACAIVTGLIGLQLGNLLGGVWEHYHKMHRGYAGVDVAPMMGWAVPAGFQGAQRDATRVVARFPSATAAARDPVAIGRTDRVNDVHYAEAGVDASSFILLAERVRRVHYDVRKTHEGLSRTTNIGAWDEGRLVGAARVLSDGYTFSALADILVDPEYQRRGIGRNLVKRAVQAAPDSRLVIDARPECVDFFARIGADRGPAGFVMTASA